MPPAFILYISGPARASVVVVHVAMLFAVVLAICVDVAMDF